MTFASITQPHSQAPARRLKRLLAGGTTRPRNTSACAVDILNHPVFYYTRESRAAILSGCPLPFSHGAPGSDRPVTESWASTGKIGGVGTPDNPGLCLRELREVRTYQITGANDRHDGAVPSHRRNPELECGATGCLHTDWPLPRRSRIGALRIGTGSLRVSLLAGCHADERVGPRHLVEQPRWRRTYIRVAEGEHATAHAELANPAAGCRLYVVARVRPAKIMSDRNDACRDLAEDIDLRAG